MQIIQLPQARDPEPDDPTEKQIVPGKLYIPIIDNGNGSVRKNFFGCCWENFKEIVFHADFSISDSLVPRGRNKAAANFLQSDCEYLLFIDTDIIFSKAHIHMMIESKEPVLAGLYCKKSRGIDPCLNTLPGMQPTQCGGYIPIRRAGTGFLRIHRDVLERMKGPKEASDVENLINDWAPYYSNHGRDEWDFFSVGVRNHEYLSEDWFFCDRARDQFLIRAKELGYEVGRAELGYSVILDSRIQVRHEGNAIYPIEETIPKNNGAEQNTVVMAA